MLIKNGQTVQEQEESQKPRSGTTYRSTVSVFTEENDDPFSFDHLCLICRIKENNWLENDSAVCFICHMTELSFLFL